MISIVAAIGENRELGANNQLLWHIPEDLKHFHDLTVGHPIIMGRKTYESIGRILPGRTNIVITRDTSYKVEGAIMVNSLEEALSTVISTTGKEEKSHQNLKGSLVVPPRDDNTHEIFIIGGGQIFAEAMPMVQRLYLTIVHATFPNADTFFPDYSIFTKVLERDDRESDGFKYSFLTLER